LKAINVHPVFVELRRGKQRQSAVEHFVSFDGGACEQKSGLRFRRPLRVLKLFPASYASGGVGGVGVFSAPVNVTVQPPPPNDNFANRITISGTNVTTSGTNVGATREAGEPFHWESTGGKSVWWTWQAPKSGTVTITTAGSSFDTILAAYTGNAVGSLSLVANNDDYNGGTSQVGFVATSRTVYQIAVDGYGGSSGSIALSIVQP
jgi:hypothetical protein